MKTAQQAASNWQQSAGRAAQAYSAGIQGYNGDWAAATTQQETALVQNFNDAVNRGDWRAGVQAVGTQGWKTAAEAKQGNYSTGFTAGAQNQAAAIAKIINAEQSIVPNLPARGSFEQNKVRMTTFIDAMHAQRGQLGAR